MPTTNVASLTDPLAARAALQARLGRLQDYLASDPQNPQLLGDVADLQLQLGQWDDAKSVLTRLLAAEPGNATARYRLAVAERSTGNAQAAQPMLAALVAEGHTHPAVLQELARSEAQLGQWQGVLNALALLDVGALPPDEADSVRLLRVRALHHLGDLEAALAEADVWQQARGEQLPLLGRAAIATLCLDAERPELAAAMVAGASPEQLAGSPELATAAGFVALSQGHGEAAQTLLTQAAAQQPLLGRAHLGLGLAAAHAGDLGRAVQALQAATAATPSHLGSWHALAWMQMLSQDLAGAEASLKAALAQDDNFGETHGGLALLAALRGERDVARAYLRTGLRLDPNGVNTAVALVALEQGGGPLDARVLGPALERFMGSPTMQSTAMQTLLARLIPARN